MSRRKKSVKRPILPDARYDSQTVSKFINAIMYQGKKSTAERIFYDAMDLVETRTSQSGVTIFKQALTNLKPAVAVKSRRVGGATYQVPVEVRPGSRTALAMRWLITFSRSRGEKSMAAQLPAEVISASQGEGHASKTRQDARRMAGGYNAVAHYRGETGSRDCNPKRVSCETLFCGAAQIAGKHYQVSAAREVYCHGIGD